MIDHIYESLYKAFHVSFTKAIEQHGINGLKKTSLFGSNDRA